MYVLQFSKKIPLSLEDCWDFFSTPLNLQTITPKYLGFKIIHPKEYSKMYAGQIIAYTIHLFGIPLEWVTEITHVQQPSYFIDEQRFGPYKFWHHEHRFEAIAKGVEMTDMIYYKLPYGFLGKLLHIKVKKDLESIFSYRSAKLDELFGIYSE